MPVGHLKGVILKLEKRTGEQDEQRALQGGGFTNGTELHRHH